jgi:hypothetical protein
MLDFETLATAPGATFVSLGAVAFNKSGVVSKELYEFDIDDQLKSGREVSAGTVAWWMKQSEYSRKVFEHHDKKIKLAEFFPMFSTFIDGALKKVGETRSELKPWGNGANADVTWLEDLYRRHHPESEGGIPWKYWNVWCYRTFNALTKCKDLYERPHGTHHNALDDSLYQVNCVLAYWAKQAERKKKKGTK